MITFFRKKITKDNNKIKLKIFKNKYLEQKQIYLEEKIKFK